MKKLKVVELYAGTGRSSEPFRQWKRAEVALLVDNNAHAKETFLHNFPKAPYVQYDLLRLSAQKLLDLSGGRIDILLGCPPCQGFSESGKRDQNDPRNNHVLRFIKLAIKCQPLVVAMENVPMAALSPQFDEAMRLLERAGYQWTAGVLNAACYGSVQTRHRLVMFATREDLAITPALPSHTHSLSGKYFDYASQKLKTFSKIDNHLLGTTSSAWRAEQALETEFYISTKIKNAIPKIAEVIGDLPEVGTEAADKLGHISWAHGKDILRSMKNVAEGSQRKNKKGYYASAYARLHRHGVARTITTYFANAGSGRFWHPQENRAITLREGARIQGFPDDFRFLNGAASGNAILVGNALDAALANATYEAIRRVID